MVSFVLRVFVTGIKLPLSVIMYKGKKSLFKINLLSVSDCILFGTPQFFFTFLKKIRKHDSHTPMISV